MGQAISYIFGDGEGGRDESSHLETRRRVAIEDKCGSGDAQQTIPKSFLSKPYREEILNSSSNDTKLSTPSSARVVDSSRRIVVQESSRSGDTQQNVQKSSLSNPHCTEVTLNSTGDARLPTSSTKVVDTSRRIVAQESSRSGDTQQNVPKSSLSNSHCTEVTLNSTGDARLPTSSTKVVDTSRRIVAQESSRSGDTQQNVPKSSLSNSHCTEVTLNSTGDARLPTSSTKVVDTSRRIVAQESSRSGDTQQNVPKSSLSNSHCTEVTLNSSVNARLPTSSTKVVDSSRRVVVEESGRSGPQQNVSKSLQSEQKSSSNTRLSTCSTKIAHSNERRIVEESDQSRGTQQNAPKSSSIEDGVISIKRIEEMAVKLIVEKLIAEWSKMTLKDDKHIKHYKSSHKMLLVGEGDFSFSACLAKAFGSAANMVATSLDSIEFLKSNYGEAISNINELKKRGCMVMHGFDVHNMANQRHVRGNKFERIIYNFPLAGFFKGKSTAYQLRQNKRLMKSFFKNARMMLSENGEIHVSHKCNGFFCKWDLVTLASNNGLQLIAAVKFKLRDYPGYNTKYGFGGDENFDCIPSKTYKFGINHQNTPPKHHCKEELLNLSNDRSLSTSSSKGVLEDKVETSGTTRSIDHASSRGYGEIEQVKDRVVTESKTKVSKKYKKLKQYYSSSHKILLVGEGDFSFSACLAKAFGSATNMVATSLDSIEFLELNYGEAISNINELKKRGCTVMHGFDVKDMANRRSVRGMKFDRIVYNFPLAGFFHGESNEYRLRRNKTLMKSYFRNAKMLLSENGEIHVSHKCTSFFRNWDLETLATESGLQLIAEAPFKLHHYPGYNTKNGFGGDENFNWIPSKTYKFVLEHQASHS